MRLRCRSALLATEAAGKIRPPLVGYELKASDAVPALLMDLDVASDESAWPVRIGRRLDAEGVGSPGFAAVIDINGERLRGCASRPNHLGRTSELGVLTSRCRGAGSAGAADNQCINGLGLYSYVRLMVVVFQVPCRSAALHGEAESGPPVGIGWTGNQGRHGHEDPERGEDRVSLDLATAGYLPGSRGYAAKACPARGWRREPGAEVDVRTDLCAAVRTDWTWPAGVAPPVAGAIDAQGRISQAEGGMNRDPICGDGDVEVVLVNLSGRE